MRRFIFAAVFAVVFFFASLVSAYAPEGKLLVTMLNVNQGDAFLIETPTQNILLDTGPVSSRASLVSQLKAAGVERIERIILTHPHADHIGGVKAVLDNFPVDQISDNGFKSSSPLYTSYRKADVTFSTLRSGDVLDLGGGVKFKVLWPYTVVDLGSMNDRSIVGQLVFGDFKMLFTGDIYARTEEFLCELDIKSTVLKAPHHGSKTSSTESFIANVQPTYIFISAALDNDFGHPHTQALDTYRSCFVLSENIFCTAFNGQVRLATDGLNVVINSDIEKNWLDNYSGFNISAVRLD